MKPERSNPSKFVFSEGHLKALITGEEGTVSRDTAEKRIKQNIKDQDQRIQHLIDDMAFLFQSDEFQQCQTILPKVAEVDKRDDVGDWKIWLSSDDPPSETKFGLVLGQLARLVIGENSEYNQNDIVWGFIIALVSLPPEDYEREEETTKKLVEYLETKLGYRKTRGYIEVENNTRYNLRKEDIQAIRNLGFVPTETLVDSGRYPAMKLKSNLDLDWEQHDPKEIVEFDVDNFEIIWEEVLIQLVSENPELSKIRKLRKDLGEDKEQLLQPGWNNIRPFDVVRSISNRGGEVEIRQIAKDISNWRADLNPQPEGVGKIVRDLSGLGRDTIGPNWADKPILEIISNDPQSCRLTNYGELFAIVFIEFENKYNELHAYALAPNKCTKRDAISEVIQEHYGERFHNSADSIRYNIKNIDLGGNEPTQLG